VKFAEVERTVVRKLHAQVAESGDRMLRIYCDCGKLLGKTKVSRKPSEQIGPTIAGAIPTQLGIDRTLWAEIFGCTKGWLEYQAAHPHPH
jgi:hypothetical protein